MTAINLDSTAPIGYADPSLQPPRKRHLLLWLVGTPVFFTIAISILMPTMCRAREPAQRIKCASNLRQIGQAIVLYAEKHRGVYPATLAMLLPETEITHEVFLCPDDDQQDNDHVSYVYVGQGLTTATADAATVVAYEPMKDHQGQGMNVLFGDGHVEFVQKQSVDRLVGERHAVNG